jgi:hypothetical protein
MTNAFLLFLFLSFLLNLELDSRLGVTVWGRDKRDVTDWRLKMKMVREGCGWLWSCRWRWIDFVTDVKLWIVSWGSGSRARRRTTRVKKDNAFFFVFIL